MVEDTQICAHERQFKYTRTCCTHFGLKIQPYEQHQSNVFNESLILCCFITATCSIASLVVFKEIKEQGKHPCLMLLLTT